MGLFFSKPSNKTPLHINRDPDSGFDFTGAEHEKHIGVAAAVNRATSINRPKLTGNGLAQKSNISAPGSSLKSSVKPVGNSNFKLNF